MLLSQNLYSYVLNNPVNMVDPSGNIPSWVGSSHSENPSFNEVYNMSIGSTFYREKWNYQYSYSRTSELRLVSAVKYDKETHYYYSGSRKKTWVYEYIKEARKILNKGTHESGGRWYSHKKIGTTTSTITYSSTSRYNKTTIETAAEQASRNEEIKQSLGEPPEDMEPTWTVTAVNGEVENGSEVLLDITSTKPDEKEKVKTAILQTELNKVLNTNLEIDGWYGNNTKSGIEVVQKRFGIDPSGKFDTKTLYQLEMALASTSNEVFVQDNRSIPIDNIYNSDDEVFGVLPSPSNYDADYYEFKMKQLFELEGGFSEGTSESEIEYDEPSDPKYNKIATNGEFGSFYYMDKSLPENAKLWQKGLIEVDPNWAKENIVKMALPENLQKLSQFKNITYLRVNKAVLSNWE